MPKGKSTTSTKSTTGTKGIFAFRTSSTSRTSRTSGFTLIELLVVIALIGILTALGLANFMTSQKKGRDADRKSSLKQLQNALETAYNDSASSAYPLSDVSGSILGCPIAAPTSSPCAWGSSSLTDNRTVYINPVPRDPKTNNRQYCYNSNGRGYQLYAQLENINDPDKLAAPVACGGSTYNYAVSSTNAIPGGALP